MAMVVGSVTLLGCRTLWYRTRTWCLVDDVPISLSQGSHYSTGELPVNLNARYGIEIYADNKIDPEKLQCMLVGPSFPSHHCDTPVLLRARWMLSSKGKTLQATSDDTVGFGEAAQEQIASSETSMVKRVNATNSMSMCSLIRAVLT
jgi:hypothetical protein